LCIKISSVVFPLADGKKKRDGKEREGKAQKVTCRQGVQNDHIFGIPEAILSIHYTTYDDD